MVALQTTVRREGRIAARWQARADRAALALRPPCARAAGRPGSRPAQRRDPALTAQQQKLADAQQTLARAQQASTASSFDPAASQLLGAPSYSGGYVFPVGGGPGEVSASHTHHDYPAVDIAAPHGRPALCARGRDRPPRLDGARPALRHRLHASRLRRPGLDLLPPLGARRDRRRRAPPSWPASRWASSGRRATPRAAPPSPAPARLGLAAAGGLVPVLRGPRLPWSDGGAAAA